MYDRSYSKVREDVEKLVVGDWRSNRIDLQSIVQSLRMDRVVLVRGLTFQDADNLIYRIAQVFGLEEALELQAEFANSLGHRSRVGRNYMTVNDRQSHQSIPPHSEGGSFVNLQLASFFAIDNTTDGGETVLMNTDESSEAWKRLREQRVKRKPGGRPLTPAEVATARTLNRLNLPEDVLEESDQVLRPVPTRIPGLDLVLALTQLRKTWSEILRQERYAYWDTVGSIDFDSAREYQELLDECDLQHCGQATLSQLDYCDERRVWNSGISYDQLFKSKITRKLTAGDFVVCNNVTWAHAVSNWTPGSGVRNVVAAFA